MNLTPYAFLLLDPIPASPIPFKFSFQNTVKYMNIQNAL